MTNINIAGSSKFLETSLCCLDIIMYVKVCLKKFTLQELLDENLEQSRHQQALLSRIIKLDLRENPSLDGTGVGELFTDSHVTKFFNKLPRSWTCPAWSKNLPQIWSRSRFSFFKRWMIAWESAQLSLLGYCPVFVVNNGRTVGWEYQGECA